MGIIVECFDSADDIKLHGAKRTDGPVRLEVQVQLLRAVTINEVQQIRYKLSRAGTTAGKKKPEDDILY